MLGHLPTLKDIIRIYGLKAKQKLSQNFILDLNITEKMITKTERKTGPFYGKTVIEVGPGPGSLTRSILSHGCKNLILVEKDIRFKPSLEMLRDSVEDAAVHICMGDALEIDEASLLKEAGATKKAWEEESDVVIVGNLPFAVATELLVKWIRQIHTREGAFEFGRAGMGLTFQKEVAHRIVAAPSSKEYGRLSVMAQHCCNTHLLFDIGSKNFVPEPKVDGSFVYLEPQIKLMEEVDLHALEEICRILFSQKRKVISNCIQKVDPAAGMLLDMAGIDPTLRPEEVSVQDWCFLANLYKLSKFYSKNKDKELEQQALGHLE